MKTMTPSRRSEAGMCLIEVVVALSMLVLVTAGAYRLVVISASLNHASRSQYIATTLARSRLERSSNFDYQDLHLLSESQVLCDQHGTPTLDGYFRRTTDVNSGYIAATLPGVTNTKITVTVEVKNWRTGRFDGIEEVVSTIFTP